MAKEVKFSLVFRDMWQSAGKYQPRVDQLVKVAPAIIKMGCFDRVETNGGGFEQMVFDGLNIGEQLTRNLLLDGFPRNVSQAQKYDEIVKEVGLDLGKVILLDISEELLIKRITGRRLCPDCGAIYNIFNPEICPKEENKCDKCGGTLYQRSDDNEEALKTRYATYVEQTAPLINYYKEKGILSVVDGGMGIDETFEQVKGIIE